MYYLFEHAFYTLLDVILKTLLPALTVSERFIIIICRPMNVTFFIIFYEYYVHWFWNSHLFLNPRFKALRYQLEKLQRAMF
jgi:hypothetical protein